MPLLKEGLHPAASDALRKLNVPVSRIGQTQGSAAASAGSHEADGAINGEEYCAATDFRVRDLSRADLRAFLAHLAGGGFAAWARVPGSDHWPADEVLHVHGIYVGIPCKTMLRQQVKDWLAQPMRNGLASHAPYTFWQPNTAQRAVVQALFTASGGGSHEVAPPKTKHILIHVGGKTLNGELDAATGIAYYTGGGAPRVPVKVKWKNASFSWNREMSEVEVHLT